MNRVYFKILTNFQTVTVSQRTIKNFGHKRQPVPLVTTLWHGFLTFSFLSLTLNWDKIRHFIFGDTQDMLLEPEKPLDKI